MSWIWLIVVFLLGISCGIIIGVVVDKDYYTSVKRIKIKGRGHTVTDMIDVTPTRRETRKARRKARKEN